MSIAAAAACSSPQPDTSIATQKCDLAEPPPALAFMTSLPIYWPTDFFSVDVKETAIPWQRAVLERCNTLVPIDTLSKDEAGFDPLAGHDRLAIIQPRGLSPLDNVALDDWVRRGGQLLLVLDPMLTGDYDFPLGDPARPVDTALIPPVVERWGLEVSFDDGQVPEPRSEVIGAASVPVLMAGVISRLESTDKRCGIFGNGVVASCQIGKGWVTIVADAAVFEHRAEGGENETSPLLHLLYYSFQHY
uniref:hypothetical protein n=1 Tax=uncultured Erythrobacter sp. TaxID=263913 RepID=UPI002618CFAB|nr:hypothetical protein [uncultured Erythrobacter sp.]